MLVVIGTDCIGNYKSYYHTITTTTAPFKWMKIPSYKYKFKQIFKKIDQAKALDLFDVFPRIFTLLLKFVSDLWQVCGFLRVLRFPLPMKLTATM
jgi:hypothetical protein